ncbi:pilus assembly protein [Telmatocola sphagniphila]|uniref:Pilus assembly protein n=1 Tax=Telmatocola sphagniphila TaxID=1123043 RepID=A0A8E6B4Y0_9BACT|nr:TadE/TadG family type IV pilus assembly protein [Telmatocola sphagniphila]QVL31176.1 pilus assembly protein [Telmatocola sphagniphila]
MRLQKSKQRRGATTVEFAVVAPVVFMMIFGIIEWSRYVMALNVTQNAVREGTRFALARTDTLQTGISVTNVQQNVANFVSQMGSSLTNVTVTVYKTNVYGQPTDQYGNVVSASTSAATFDQTSFGDYICVTVTGTYKPVLPTFLNMTNLTSITTSCVMCSEGN